MVLTTGIRTRYLLTLKGLHKRRVANSTMKYLSIEDQTWSTSPPNSNLKGTYCLLMELPVFRKIKVGRLGWLEFQLGYYLYLGSAFGPGGLKARINRHLKSIKKYRWHIDYLRRFCSMDSVYFSTEAKNLECVWSNHLSSIKNIQNSHQGFGSSDCSCFAHLFYCKKKPDLTRLLSSPAKKS